MSRTLSLLYRKLIIEPRLEVLVIGAIVLIISEIFYIGYLVYWALFSEVPLPLLIPTVLLGVFIAVRLVSWNSDLDTTRFRT